jgi:transcriptional regulator with XRE-family HTH domain
MSCFRKNLRDELDYQGLTVKELAIKSSVSKGALDCYLGVQASMPSADAAVKIAHVLGVSVERLVTGCDTLPPPIINLNPEMRLLVRAIEHLPEEDRRLVVKAAISFAEALRGRADRKP